jgi:hypothetical protein
VLKFTDFGIQFCELLGHLSFNYQEERRSAMTGPAIKQLEEKLESILAQLKTVKDPYLRRSLLADMRKLMAELDRLVYPATDDATQS